MIVPKLHLRDEKARKGRVFTVSTARQELYYKPERSLPFRNSKEAKSAFMVKGTRKEK